MTLTHFALASTLRKQWKREWLAEGLAELFASHCLQEWSNSLNMPHLIR